MSLHKLFSLSETDGVPGRPARAASHTCPVRYVVAPYFVYMNEWWYGDSEVGPCNYSVTYEGCGLYLCVQQLNGSIQCSLYS